MPARSIFNKVGGSAQSFFNKAPSALRQFSGGLGSVSRGLGRIAAQGDSVLNDPSAQRLARDIGLGGAFGSLRGATGAAGSASSLLNRASQITNPSTYGNKSPYANASSAIEKSKSLARDSGKMFM